MKLRFENTAENGYQTDNGLELTKLTSMITLKKLSSKNMLKKVSLQKDPQFSISLLLSNMQLRSWYLSLHFKI